jgi:ligand-binding sensor domain-containing protein
VTALAQDFLGRIWTGHKDGRLAYLEGDQFRTFDPPEGSSTNEISDILFDRKGNLWFSTLNDGLYYFIQDRLFRIDEEEGLPDIYVYDIVEDRFGNIWAGTDGGAAICKLQGRQVTIQVLDYDHGLPDIIVKKFHIDRNNTVWMGTEDAGVLSFDPATGKTSSLIKSGWQFGNLTDFSFDGDQVWISTPQSGLVLYDLKTAEAKLYNSNTGFDFMSVNTLLTDYEGNIWIGTKSGVVRTLGDHVEYIDHFDPYENTSVLALTVDKQNNIWFSTGDGLFKRSIDKSGKAVVEQLPFKTSLKSSATISLYTDSAGYIWAGLYGEGVLRINPATKMITHLNKELGNGNVLSIAGRGNEVWLATLGGGIQIRFFGDVLEVKNYGRSEGLVSDYVYQVFIDSQKRIWFATDGKGAAMLDKSGFHHYEKGLSSKVLYGFAEDGNQRIWVNVQGEGVYQFDGAGFQPLGKEILLRDKNIYGLSTDTHGNLIMLNDLGIDIYDLETKKVRYMGEEVGIRDMKPNLNALAKDQAGRIYIGTDHGIMKYSDGACHSLTLPVPAIEELTVVGKKVELASKLSFAHNQNSVIVHYLGFWYQNPSSLTFRYRLEDYDRDWIESRDRSATYSSLPPGNYTFRLRVSDTENFMDAEESTLTFTIRSPFWKEVWFYFLCGAIILGSAYGYIHYRERKLVESKRVLREKVKERTQEIQIQNEEIQAQNEEIQAQAEEIQGINDNLESLVRARTIELEKKNKAAEESAFIIAHELRAPVASVLGLINLISKCKLDDDARTIVTHMEDSAEKLNAVVRNITKAIERGDH